MWFDRQLIPDQLAGDDWTLTSTGSLWEGIAAEAAGNLVTVHMHETETSPDPPLLDYTASNHDVRSLASGLPALPFYGFPYEQQ